MFRAFAALAGLSTVALFGLSTHADDKNRPHAISPEEAGIGSSMPHLEGKDLAAKSVALGAGQITVVALTSTTCPLAKKLAPTLAGLEDRYAKKGIRFVFVNPESGLSTKDLRAGVKAQSLDGTYVNDASWAEALDAKTTTEAFVFDAKGKLTYRGAVDDQYGIGYSLSAPKNRYLANALDAVLAGKAPKLAATWAPGCVLEATHAEEVAVKYYENVAPIIQEKCLSCHREGGVGPFKLDSYEAVKSRAPMLKYVIEKGIMPPWFAKTDGKKSPFRNDMSLSEDQKKQIYAWIENGTPTGDKAAAPKPPKFDPNWHAGTPDYIVRLPKPFKVQATGFMPYQEVVVPTGLTEDKWIQGMEVKPSARQVVHHVLVFIREKGQERRENPGEEITGFFAAYVPGTDSVLYPDGFAKKLPAGASLKFQIHYTPNGTATEDLTELGLHFADKPVQHEVHTVGIANLFINIPPGAERHEEKAAIPVPFDAKVMSLIPHMHVRGVGARYELTKPDGQTQTILDVPKYDFNWQLPYEFADYVDAPKGSKITFTAWYDNSDKNPANPDPTRRVRWGSQTVDEMHLGYVEYFVPSLKPGDPIPGQNRRGSGAFITTVFQQMDKDADGFITEKEAGIAWTRLKTADANGDGKLTLEEALKAFGQGG